MSKYKDCVKCGKIIDEQKMTRHMRQVHNIFKKDDHKDDELRTSEAVEQVWHFGFLIGVFFHIVFTL